MLEIFMLPGFIKLWVVTEGAKYAILVERDTFFKS